jgi:hypothetical protein
VAAAGSATLSGGATTTFYRVDSTGATAATINIPGSGTAVDGQTAVISLTGATAAAGVTITPGAGANMADPNNPGQFTGAATAATIRTVGAIFGLKYQTATTTWVQER